MKSVQKISVERADRLKKLRAMTGKNRKDFAKRHQISVATIQNWEAPRFGGLSEKGARKMIQCLACEGIYVSQEWLMMGLGNQPQLAQGSVRSEKNHERKRFSATQVKKETMALKKLYKKNTMYELQDEGLIPFYEPGDIFIGVLRESTKEQTAMVNGLCIVQLEGGVRVLRYVKKIIPRLRKVSLYGINMKEKCEHSSNQIGYQLIWKVVAIQFKEGSKRKQKSIC